MSDHFKSVNEPLTYDQARLLVGQQIMYFDGGEVPSGGIGIFDLMKYATVVGVEQVGDSYYIQITDMESGSKKSIKPDELFGSQA